LITDGWPTPLASKVEPPAARTWALFAQVALSGRSVPATSPVEAKPIDRVPPLSIAVKYRSYAPES
jgi:hypothetical protein